MNFCHLLNSGNASSSFSLFFFPFDLTSRSFSPLFGISTMIFFDLNKLNEISFLNFKGTNFGELQNPENI